MKAKPLRATRLPDLDRLVSEFDPEDPSSNFEDNTASINGLRENENVYNMTIALVQLMPSVGRTSG